jgi:predicted ATPase with chaperone activity
MKAKYSFESPITTYRHLPISKEGMSFIQKVLGTDKGSVRSLNRWLQTSFSMMFLDQNSQLTEEQLAEALSFKRLN